MGASRAERAVVETFIEPTFKDDSGKAVRPDGLIQVAFGKKPPFVALVEVKTGPAKLGADQINAYWDIARREGFDAVVTISNEIAPSFGVHPTEGLKVKSNSKAAVHHLSWTRVLSLAVTEKTHRGIDDPEQDWILGELIRYLEHDASGTLGFDDMGVNWVEVRDGARDGTLNSKSDAVTDVAVRWDQLLSFVSLRLGADIGEDVVDIHITVDLKARQNIVSVDVDAPTDKGARGRISWLVRQLREAPGALVVEAYPKGGQNGIAGPLEAIAEDPSILLREDKKDPHRFRVIARSELGKNRRSGKSPGFVQSVINAIESFYGDVLQDMTAYQPKAPQLKSVVPATPEPELPSVPLVVPAPSPSPERRAIPLPPAGSTWQV